MTHRSIVTLTVAALFTAACGGSSSESAGVPPPAGQSVVVAVDPKAATVPANGSATFAAAVSGTSILSVTWTVQPGSNCGSVSAGGVYTAPNAGATCTVVATSAADTTKSGSATVTVTPPPAHVVAISPGSASVLTGGTTTFSATVTGTTAGESTAVTWSVPAGAGSIGASTGVYVAPASPGTYVVTATSVATPSGTKTATVTVTAAPVIAVSVSPATSTIVAGGTATFAATVTGTTAGESTAVTWSVPAGAGSIGASTGVYVAPASPGTYVVTATSVADTSKKGTATVTVITSGGGGSGGAPDSDLAFLPADRATKWNPGVQGGIPARSTVCATVNASTYGNGATDATSGIQSAIDACPAGQVVKLSAGTFRVSTGGRYLEIAKGITLRGAGAGQTILQKTDGAKPNTEATGSNPSPIIIVGPARWANGTGFAASVNLSADGVKGSYSVTVASGSGFAAGQIVLLDELSRAAWQTDPGGRGKVWASADWRVTWQLHNPSQGTDDPLTLPANAANQDAFMWFGRLDRPTAEVKEIASVSGNTITFTTPVHITYRTANTAQLSRYGADVQHTKGAGVEDLSVIGGDNGQIRFEWAASSWARNVENSVWHDEGFAINNSFRIEIREAYVHDAAWAQPGGAGYAISFGNGSAECLIENSIIVRANKVMVSRSAGAGSVIGYNYVDEGYINTNGAWQEVGLNGSHMVGPHHMLFEGNYGFNFDSDKTHGSAIFHTVFRNHLSGVRHSFVNPHTGSTIDDVLQTNNGPQRCAGLGFYSYWHSFVGNVMGRAGAMSGWVYETTFAGGGRAIWMLGWDDWNPYPVDPQVASTTLRDGNFDYVTNTVHWDRTAQTIPNSFYLSAKPAFFGSLTWPWVDPTGTTKLHTLPAKARFDAL